MGHPVRRVVTSVDGSGTPAVTHDGAPPVAIDTGDGGGVYDLWLTETMPPPIDGPDLLEGGERIEMEPTADGTLFRLVRFSPGQQVPEHSTQSIDYVTVVEGRVHLLLGGAEVELEAGQCLVQRGPVHGWHNRSDQPCVVSVVQVSTR